MKIWINDGKGGGRYIDGWTVEKGSPLEKIVKKMRAQGDLREAFGSQGEKVSADQKKYLYKMLVAYAQRRYDGSMPRARLEDFANGLGYTSAMIAPILQQFIRQGSEADKTLFDVSVWEV